MRPQGLKPALILGLYAALKRRSSTVVHAFVNLPATSEVVPFPSLLAIEFFDDLAARLNEVAEKVILVFRSEPRALKRRLILSDLRARVELVPFPNQPESGFFRDL